HYAPRARVVAVTPSDAAERIAALIAQHPTERIAVLAPRSLDLAAGIERIDVPDDDTERARTLYASLRSIDERGATLAIIVLPADERGLGLAIADRVRRAAGPRD
ncbi:MAG: translation factor Sua5, partial [Myxococcota bacterium]|nr:translation factor Sua5 [Myxococcota bacterium]